MTFLSMLFMAMAHVALVGTIVQMFDPNPERGPWWAWCVLCIACIALSLAILI